MNIKPLGRSSAGKSITARVMTVDFHLNLNTETVDHANLNEPVCLEPDTPTRKVIDTLKEHNLGCALICREEVLEGIFTERDVLKLMAGGADLDVPISQYMVRDPVTLSSSDTVGKAISKMSFGGYRRLPIIDDDGKPVGLLKVPGILHYMVEHFPQVIYNLPPTPHHNTQNREGA